MFSWVCANFIAIDREFTLIHVLDPKDVTVSTGEQLLQSYVDHFKDVIDRLKGTVPFNGKVGIHTKLIQVHHKSMAGPNHFGPAITDFCFRDPPQLLITASRGLSAVKRFTAGSVSDHCVHHAPCPVVVYKRDKNSTIDPRVEAENGTVLLAVDGSDRSLSVYNFTINNILKPKQHMTIVHVYSTSHTDAQWNGVKLLEEYSTRAKTDGLESRVTTHLGKAMLAGKYITKLCDATSMTPAEREQVTGVSTKDAPFMLIVASRGLNKVKRALVGSVSDHCVHNAECPVLVFKTPPSLSLRVAAGVSDIGDLRPVSATVSVSPSHHTSQKSPASSLGKADTIGLHADLLSATADSSGGSLVVSNASSVSSVVDREHGKKRSVSMTSRSAGSEESTEAPVPDAGSGRVSAESGVSATGSGRPSEESSASMSNLADASSLSSSPED